MASVLLTACGGGGGGDATPVPAGGGSSPEGILLEGDPAALAIDAVRDYDADDRTTAAEISTNADGARIDRTNLDIEFVGTATSGEINTLLQSVDSQIVSMLEGVNIILVRIPDPGDLAGLDAVITILEASPLVISVAKAYMLETAALPANHDVVFIEPFIIDHTIAVLAPAAWNAKAALSYQASRPPLLLIQDYFGEEAPDNDIDLNLPSPENDFDINVLDPDDFSSVAPNEHGYHVLGIISGKHNTGLNERSPRQLVTGMYPGTLDVRVVDLANTNSQSAANKILNIIKTSPKKVVYNTSLSDPCPQQNKAACIEENAHFWLKKMRGMANYNAGMAGVLEEKYLHATAAGNIINNFPADVDAILTSGWTAARLMPGLTNDSGILVPNLSNTLVVENRKNKILAPYKVDCLSDSSKTTGDISAIGEEVYSFTNANTTAGNLSGTSMASPQVAGLMAYMWALKPSLTPEEVLERIIFTAQNTTALDPTCSESPALVIDAYAAILSVDNANVLDSAAAASLFDAPARLAILDPVDSLGFEGGDRIFDEKDIEAFINEFTGSSAGDLNYGRYDLNGDGYTVATGDSTGAVFNLDMQYPLTLEDVTQDINGTTVTYNENSVTDWQILCYYAYSPLYTGIPAQRDTLLAPYRQQCGIEAKIAFSSNRDGNMEIYVMNTDGSNPVNLTQNGTVDVEPAWSPGGDKIAFRSTRDGNAEIYVMNADGSNPVNLSQNTAFESGPVWSPDGSKIAFISLRDGSIALYIMNSDGTNQVNLTQNDTNVYSPQWSPDGSKIAYVNVSNREGNQEIYVVDADGMNQVNLTQNAATDAFPTWSPDSLRISFASTRDGPYRIYIMNSDGTNQVGLSQNTLYNKRPSWSPDGSKIAFSNTRENSPGVFVEEINVINPDGSNQTVLQNDVREVTPLVWSPDGSKIVFETGRDGNVEIYVMNADGSNPVNLTQNNGFDNEPVWSP